MASPALVDWLKTEKAENICTGRTVPISVSATDKVGQVFQVLMTANILSAPVYDEKAKDHVSIIDIMDILASSIMLDEQKELGKAFAEALLSALKDKDKEIPDISTLISQQSLFKNVEVRDIASMMGGEVEFAFVDI